MMIGGLVFLSCLLFGVRPPALGLLAVGCSQVLDSDRGLRESSQPLFLPGAGNSPVVQRPGLGAHTLEPQA